MENPRLSKDLLTWMCDHKICFLTHCLIISFWILVGKQLYCAFLICLTFWSQEHMTRKCQSMIHEVSTSCSFTFWILKMPLPAFKQLLSPQLRHRGHISGTWWVVAAFSGRVIKFCYVLFFCHFSAKNAHRLSWNQTYNYVFHLMTMWLTWCCSDVLKNHCKNNHIIESGHIMT